MKYLFLFLISLSVNASCFTDEFDFRLRIAGEVTSEEYDAIVSYCEIKELEEDLKDEEENS